jgi:hypothetical protein
MIVFGGRFTGPPAYNDVWELSLAGPPTWSQIVPTGPVPAARSPYTAVAFDPDGNRLIVFAGSGESDAWQLSLAGTPAWTQLASMPGPYCCTFPVAFHDPVRNRMVLVIEYFTQNHTWALPLDGSSSWSQLAPGGPATYGRWEHGALYDPVRDRMVMFGGRTPSFRNDTWFLEFSDLAAVDRSPLAPSFMLGASYPNPARSALAIPFTLARPSAAIVRVYDLGGRRMRTLFDGTLDAGAHALRWDGRTDTGVQAAPGVYLAELRVGNLREAKRVVLAR